MLSIVIILSFGVFISIYLINFWTDYKYAKKIRMDEAKMLTAQEAWEKSRENTMSFEDMLEYIKEVVLNECEQSTTETIIYLSDLKVTPDNQTLKTLMNYLECTMGYDIKLEPRGKHYISISWNMEKV